MASTVTPRHATAAFVTTLLCGGTILGAWGASITDDEYTMCCDQQDGQVTVDNFECAETDAYFQKYVDKGGLGKFHHIREITPVTSDEQDVIRMNRDTLYSMNVLDLEAGSATITVPEAAGRFLSVNIVSNCHDSFPVIYDAGEYDISKDTLGTRNALVLVRTFVNPTNETDIEEAHKVQDGFSIEQSGGEDSKFEPPEWDAKELDRIRSIILELQKTTTTPGEKMYGLRNETDRLSHIMGTASGWGAAKADACFPVFVTPPDNGGETTYSLNVPKNVPITQPSFWSVSVYNDKGFYFMPGPHAFNDHTAEQNDDGSTTLRFGGCDDPDRKTNCMPITNGWTYLVRLYRPEEEILDGSWTFPEPEKDVE